MSIKDARSLPPIAQEDLRRKAVRAVVDGMTQEEAGKLFGVTRQAIINWLKKYREGGERALRARRRGRPKRGSLEPWQAAQIVRAIEDRCPDQLKLPFFLWTREAVGALIAKRFGIRLSVWTVGRYLAQWGFTPQKPIRRAFEQDEEKVQRWLQEEYPEIRKLAKGKKAEIYWGDEMGMRSDHACGRSYGRRGETPVILGTGQRFGCSMISAITNRGQIYFMVFKRRFRAEVFLDFLRRLVRQVGRRVYLILDQHPVHKAGKVKKWLQKHQDSIKVFHLPSYSPELNPDEYLNQDVKSNAVGRCRPQTQDEMVQGIRGYLRSRQRQPHLVRKYFEAKSVSYAAL
jgi:transposase